MTVNEVEVVTMTPGKNMQDWQSAPSGSHRKGSAHKLGFFFREFDSTKSRVSHMTHVQSQRSRCGARANEVEGG